MGMHLQLELNASNNNIQWGAMESERKLLAWPVNSAAHLHLKYRNELNSNKAPAVGSSKILNIFNAVS